MNPHQKTSFHYNLEDRFLTNLNVLLQAEEDFWKLKSRIQWLNERNANTKFIHFTTIHRRRRNHILGLVDSVGNCTFDPNTIYNTITNQFQLLYTTQITSTPKLYSNYSYNVLSNAIHQMLTQTLTYNEIYWAISSFQPFKAPGLDDLHPSFFRKFWEDTKLVIVTICTTAFSSATIPAELNKTFLTLIPKVQNPETLLNTI